jgi:hypothetical protein
MAPALHHWRSSSLSHRRGSTCSGSSAIPRSTSSPCRSSGSSPRSSRCPAANRCSATRRWSSRRSCSPGCRSWCGRTTCSPPVPCCWFFSLTTFLIAIPTGIKFVNWIGTMWQGRITFETPMLWAVGFLVTFLLGGQLHRAAPHPLRAPGIRAALPAPRRTVPRRGTHRGQAVPLRGAGSARRARGTTRLRSAISMIDGPADRHGEAISDA